MMSDEHTQDAKSRGETLLNMWYRSLRTLQNGHFMASAYYGWVAKALGVPVVIGSSVVSSAVFSTLSEADGDNRIKMVAGGISIFVTVFSSLQTFLGFAERATHHKQAAIGYGSLRTESQVMLVDIGDISTLQTRLDSIRNRWSKLDEDAPTLKESFVVKAKKKCEREDAKKHG